MKKLIAVSLCLMLAVSLAACGTASQQPNEEKVQLANPYLTFETAEQMEKSAKMTVSLPEQLPQWVSETIYRAIPGELIEVIYTDGDNEIRVRIKNGDEDISGVYDADTKEEKDVLVGENRVHLKGETQENGELLVFVSTWNTEEGRTYSVTSRNGVPESVFLPIIGQIQ